MSEEKYSAEDIKRVRNEYYRKWRKNNPEKVRAAQIRYWERQLESSKTEAARVFEDVETRKE